MNHRIWVYPASDIIHDPDFFNMIYDNFTLDTEDYISMVFACVGLAGNDQGWSITEDELAWAISHELQEWLNNYITSTGITDITADFEATAKWMEDKLFQDAFQIIATLPSNATAIRCLRYYTAPRAIPLLYLEVVSANNDRPHPNV